MLGFVARDGDIREGGEESEKWLMVMRTAWQVVSLGNELLLAGRQPAAA